MRWGEESPGLIEVEEPQDKKEELQRWDSRGEGIGTGREEMGKLSSLL